MLARRFALSFAALIVVVSCGDNSPTAETTPGTTPAPADTVSALPKPAVKIPAELPTTLVITDLTVGTGDAAKVGDTVVVQYVGVRSADGTEFDTSYDDGTPFDVLLGAGRVIVGWDQGLLGIQTGGRRQLDIPAELAYADRGSGDIIKPGDALTFVIDAVAIVPAANPADEPSAALEPADNIESFTFEDVVVGDGVVPEAGKKVAIQIVAYRADTGAKINSTWADGQPFVFPFGTGQALLGLELAVDNMKVGGRRLATIPFTLAFGEEGSEGLGLPPSTDMVVLIDLVAVF